jgi:predicted acetyltransferase
MIRHHLHGLHESGGEAVSGLHASEPAIYGRFGYGLATSGHRLRIPRGAPMRVVSGVTEVVISVHTADPKQHTDLVTELEERAADRRPGMIIRSPGLRGRELVDRPARRAGREALRLIVAHRDGEATGYALLRREVRFDGATAGGTASVDALVAVDAATARALWGFVTDLDLIDTIQTPSVAGDDALVQLLVDPRKPRPVRSDDLWLRLVDVDRALASRGYATDIDLVIDLSDTGCPWNARRWRLAGDGTGATCAATTDPAEVSVDVRELGAAYVGGTSLAALAMAGLVEEHRPGAVAQLSAALRSAVEPVSPYVF